MTNLDDEWQSFICDGVSPSQNNKDSPSCLKNKNNSRKKLLDLHIENDIDNENYISDNELSCRNTNTNFHKKIFDFDEKIEEAPFIKNETPLLKQIILHNNSIDDFSQNQEKISPKCSNIYISTKTKIAFLNKPINIKNVFWNIPILPYSSPTNCAIKKQIKISTINPEELDEIKEHLKNEKYFQVQEIEHIENPNGRIKFKVQLKINVGLCKKDILNYRCKLKRAFFNCFVVILRMKDEETGNFKEMHVKVFNTGKLEIPGIQNDKSLFQVVQLLIQLLKPIIGEDLDYIRDNCETVLINSNFNCGYFINRDKLYNILKYKYRINSNYDACSYPGIQCKFYYIPGQDVQTGQQPMENKSCYEISFMIFRTGSVLIVGRCDENVLFCIYDFLKKLLEDEYPIVGNEINIIEPKKHNIKLRKKTINVIENI